jgi:hypothetical protein
MYPKQKKRFFVPISSVVTFTSVSKDIKSLKSRKSAEIKVVHNFFAFAFWLKFLDPDLDPDPYI